MSIPDHSAKPNLPQKSTAFQGKFQVFSKQHLETLPQLQKLTPDHRLAMRAVAEVLPFRVNNYVVEELIDWDNVPNDPVFQLTFPQPGMLAREDSAADATRWFQKNGAVTLKFVTMVFDHCCGGVAGVSSELHVEIVYP